MLRLLPKIPLVLLVLLPKIFDAPPLLLHPNIQDAPLFALFAKELMEALPPLPELLPAQLLPKVKLPRLLADLAGSPLKLRVLVLDAVLSNDDPLPAAPVLLFSLLKMLSVPFLLFPKMLA